MADINIEDVPRRFKVQAARSILRDRVARDSKKGKSNRITNAVRNRLGPREE